MKTGMRAVDGAVSAVSMENDRFYVTTIGDAPPRGICGSGIVDLLAVLFLNGKIDRLGKFREEASQVTAVEGVLGIFYAPGLFFSQGDLDAFLRTKAAANTMVSYILEDAGIPMEAVERFYVAGAFGKHLNKEAAVTIGLYPDMPRERIVNAGNSALDGAGKILLDRTWIHRLSGYVDKMEYIQFGNVGDFVSRMTAAMAIPHTDLRFYPTVAKKLGLV